MMGKSKREMDMDCIADKIWRVPNDLGEMARTALEVEEWLKGFPLPSRVPYSARVIVEEMGTNIVKYAYADAEPHTIRVQVFVAAGGVTVTLEDDGKAFDPFEAPLPDVVALMGKPGEGGLGLSMVRKVCRAVAYERREGKNRVRMEIEPVLTDDTQILPGWREFAAGQEGGTDK